MADGEAHHVAEVGELHFVHDVVAVAFDGARGDTHGESDFLVAFTGGEQAQHFDLALGERNVVGGSFGLGGYGGARIFDEAVDHFVGEAAGEEGAIVADVADGGDQIGVCVGFEHVTEGADFERFARDGFGEVHRKNDDLRFGAFLANRGSDFEPVHFRHGEIEEQQIGSVLSYVLDGFRAGAGLRGDFEIGLEFKDGADAATYDAMVVGDLDPVPFECRKVRDLGLDGWHV